jgi:hypothetical protein
MKTGRALTVCFALVALALLLWHFVEDGVRPVGFLRARDWDQNAPGLDSFSESSVALAVLKQEADRLVSVYALDRDQAGASESAHLLAGVPLGAQAAPASSSSSPPSLHQPAAPETSAIKLLATLHAGVQDLEADLNRDLIGAYCQNGSWSEFLDCYLRLVQQSPEQPGVAGWAPFALACAQKYGRAEEVADALRHVIRFHGNLRSAKGLRAVLAIWEAENSPRQAVSKR